MKYIPIILIFTILIFLLHYTIEVEKLEEQIKSQQKEIERLEWYEKRVKNYMLINLKQSDIINRYQSSRNDAQNDEDLQELILNLE
jgi:Mg2+ and Co2+ transporter CorA